MRLEKMHNEKPRDLARNFLTSWTISFSRRTSLRYVGTYIQTTRRYTRISKESSSLLLISSLCVCMNFINYILLFPLLPRPVLALIFILDGFGK